MRHHIDIRPIGDTVVERIGTIKNPLTIIAMFAAIAEISGTVVLPFISLSSQSTYVWFLIVFPTLLIVFFFVTLNFNHRVLYAPSDYKNEDNFLKSLRRATYGEKAVQVEAELAETTETADVADVADVAANGTATLPIPSSDTQIRNPGKSAMAIYAKAENLVFKKLGREFKTNIERDVLISASARRPYIFDGVVREHGQLTVIEVKLVRDHLAMVRRIRENIMRVGEGIMSLPETQRWSLRLLLILVVDGSIGSIDVIAGEVSARLTDGFRRDLPFSVEVRSYRLSELENEFQADD
jgi:hypothetical protein